VKNCCKAGEATDDNITWRTHFSCWITKATDTRSEYVIPIAFTARMVTRTHLSIKLYVRFLSCYILYRHSPVSNGNTVGSSDLR
jgi:hypothetical protein